MLDFNLIPLLPEIFLALIAMGLLMVGAWRGNEATGVICWAAVYGLLLAALVLMGVGWQEQIVLGGMFKFDQFAGLMKLLILAGLMAALVLAPDYLKKESIARFEYPVLVLTAGIGMMLMVSAHNLLGLYVALELQSLSLYVLAAFHRNLRQSAEAGIKYFILGALSSGMLLFGISLIYGFTGSIDYSVIMGSLDAQDTIPFGVTFGLVFILAGLAFKISAVPFHMWTPDVYQGAPTSVTALFAIVPKLAAMAMLIRLLYEPFSAIAEQWQQILYFLAVASMVVGAFGAIAQDNLKRLLAYSSIGHMGYALIGLAVGSPAGAGAVVLYLTIYMMMSIGVFAIIMMLRRDGREALRISDLGGLSAHSPVAAYCMAILMFSMTGIPPLAGFFGKLVIFQSAVEAGYYVLAVIGVLTSVVAAYYYLRIIKVMFFDEGADPFEKDVAFSIRAVLFISILFVVGFIFKPSLLIDSTVSSVSIFFSG